jgi:hypothetical protein
MRRLPACAYRVVTPIEELHGFGTENAAIKRGRDQEKLLLDSKLACIEPQPLGLSTLRAEHLSKALPQGVILNPDVSEAACRSPAGVRT